MQNLQYLKEIRHNEDTFEIFLKPITERYDNNVQLQIAISLFELFNNEKYINAKDITHTKDNTFYVRKDKYPNIANNRE